MPSVHRTVLFLTFVIGTTGIGIVSSQNPDSEKRLWPPETRTTPAQTIGMAGCAATGCHGRPNTRPGTFDADTWHESFSLWIDRDPHTRSYSVLEGSLAVSIMKNLHAGDSSIPLDATRDARCLACHTNPSLATADAMKADGLNRIRAEGVSCEACHGNAEKWQIAHTNAIPPAERTQRLGDWQMNDLNDWHVQAMTCAGCHIGAKEDKDRGLPLRDMNHDMIAAGHPRLEFDFPTYHAKLSPHWQPRNRSTGRPPDDDAMLRAWLQGQLAVEQAYCELSLDRIQRGNTETRSPYPEFADWNCSQCHHNLAPAPWRESIAKSQTAGDGAIRGLGRPAWVGASVLVPFPTPPRFGDKRAVQESSLNATRQTAREFGTTLAKNPGVETRRLIEQFLATPTHHPANWEDATRAYLGLRSLEFSLTAAKTIASGESKAQFDQLRSALWGSSNEPPRKEHARTGYHRKPEGRWTWENDPKLRPDSVDATLEALRKSLLADLKKLPPPASKP